MENNIVSKNFSGKPEASSIEGLEIKMRDKLDDHKKEIKVEIEKIETAVNARIELVEAENKELKRQITVLNEAHIQHQNTTTQSNNVVHERLNIQQRDIQDIRHDIRLVNQKLDLINSDTRNAGAAYANTFIEKIKSATNVPSHTPEQLKTILELIGEYRDKTDKNEKDPTKKTVTRKKWQDMIIKAAQEGLLSMAQAGIDASLTMRDCRIKYDELVQDSEGKVQAGQFLESFATGLANEIISIHPSAETVKLALDAIKVAFALGKFVYKLNKANQVRKEIKAYWENEVEENMEEMINLLRTPTKEFLDIVINQYLLGQMACYGRDDVEFKKSECWFYGNKKSPYYTRTFKDIPNYHENVPEYTDVSVVINTMCKFRREGVHVLDFIGGVLKDREEQTFRRFNYLLKCLLAVRGLGEFRKNLSGVFAFYRNSSNVEHPIPYSLVRNVDVRVGVHLTISSIATGVFAIPIAEGVKRRIYANNTPRLIEYMRKLLINYSSEACNLIIEQLVALTKLRIYNEATGCEFGKFCYNLLVDEILAGKIRGKNDEVKSSNKQIFIEAFHLLEKMNNVGIANREIFFDTIIQTSVESQSMSNICSDFTDRLTGMYQEALSRNPNPLNVVVHTRPKNQFTFTDQKQKREISK